MWILAPPFLKVFFGTTFSKGGLKEALNTHGVQQALANVNKECVHNDDD
jgi:hypothetical protein